VAVGGFPNPYCSYIIPHLNKFVKGFSKKIKILGKNIFKKVVKNA
jgi:hypothetical protein